MTAFQPLIFFWGETWELEVEAADQAGNLFTPAYAAIRIGNAAGLMFDIESPDPAIQIEGTSVLAYVTLAAQLFPPSTTIQDLVYEVRAGDNPSRAYTLQAGSAKVRPSLFGAYPWTPPDLGGLLLEGGGYLALEQGGVLLLEAA